MSIITKVSFRLTCDRARVSVENFLLLLLTFLKPRWHFWNKNDEENMSRRHQIWNRTIRTWFFNVLKSADFRCPVLKIRSGKLLVFASLGFIMSIPNPKHHRLPWDDFLLDPTDDKPSWTFCGPCLKVQGAEKVQLDFKTMNSNKFTFLDLKV